MDDEKGTGEALPLEEKEVSAPTIDTRPFWERSIQIWDMPRTSLIVPLSKFTQRPEQNDMTHQICKSEVSPNLGMIGPIGSRAHG